MPRLENNETDKKIASRDEIDLMLIFNYFGRLFKRISNSFSFALSAIKANSLVMLSLLFLGGALGYAAYKVTKPYYVSTMTLMLSNIRNEFVEDQLNKLSEMVSDDNYDAIADRLDISTNAARQIKSLKFSNLDQDRIAEDSILTGSPFRIELSLYNNKLFSSMEPAIANYLENNRYFSKQKRIRQRQVESMISKLKGEINSIDSVKTVVVSPRGPVSGFVYGEPIDPTNLYRESLSMYRQQVDMEAELDQLDNIQVVTGFSPRSNPTGPNLIKFVGIGAVVFFFFGVIFVYKKEKARIN